MARTPRSLFFSYAQSGNPLTAAKDKGASMTAGWKLGDQTGKITELKCPKTLGTSPIMFTATALARTLAPDLKTLPIPEPRFVRFLNKEGAEDKYWTMRFWEVNDDEGWSRAITAGRETPDIWTEIVTAMNRRTRKGGRAARRDKKSHQLTPSNRSRQLNRTISQPEGRFPATIDVLVKIPEEREC